MPTLMSPKKLGVAKYFLDYSSGGSRLAWGGERGGLASGGWLRVLSHHPLCIVQSIVLYYDPLCIMQCVLHCIVKPCARCIALHCIVPSPPVQCALHWVWNTARIALHFSVLSHNSVHYIACMHCDLNCSSNLCNVLHWNVPPPCALCSELHCITYCMHCILVSQPLPMAPTWPVHCPQYIASFVTLVLHLLPGKLLLPPPTKCIVRISLTGALAWGE